MQSHMTIIVDILQYISKSHCIFISHIAYYIISHHIYMHVSVTQSVSTILVSVHIC